MESHEPDNEISIEDTGNVTDNVAIQPKIERNQIKRPRLLKQYSRVSSKNSLNIKKSESKEPDKANPLSPTSKKIHPLKCQESHNARHSQYQYFNKVLQSCRNKYQNVKCKNHFLD